MQNSKHWTAESDAALIHKLGFDFISQLEKRMEKSNLKQAKLARRLNISEGAVSKMLNNPQNLTLKTIAKYSKALGIKAAIVAYDDDDPTNEKGLIPSEIFSTCWQNAGRPRDFWSVADVRNISAATTKVTNIIFVGGISQTHAVLIHQGHASNAMAWPANPGVLAGR